MPIKYTAITVVLLAFVSLAFGQTNQERYHLVPAQVSLGDDRSTHELFLVDSQTGKVWRYVPRIGKLLDVPKNEQGATDVVAVPTGAFVPVEQFESKKDVGEKESKK